MGLGFWVLGIGFGVSGLRGLGCRMYGLRAEGLVIRAFGGLCLSCLGFGFRVLRGTSSKHLVFFWQEWHYSVVRSCRMLVSTVGIRAGI